MLLLNCLTPKNMKWIHNQRTLTWELSYLDVPRNEFVMVTWITDEILESAPEMASMWLTEVFQG